MEGLSFLAFLVGLVVTIVMMLAQIKLFAIARTLESILVELQNNRQPSGPAAEPQPGLTPTQNEAPTPSRTFMDRLGGKL